MLRKVDKKEFHELIRPYDYDVWESELGNIEFSVNDKIIGMICYSEIGREFFVSDYTERELALNKSCEKILIISVLSSLAASIIENILLSRISGLSLVPLFIGLNIFLYMYSKRKA